MLSCEERPSLALVVRHVRQPSHGGALAVGEMRVLAWDLRR